jgi:cell division protein FtsN
VQAVAQAAYTVQVGVFWEENRAARLAGQLREEGTDAYIQSGEINGETVYRVMVGVYTDWSVAKNKADARRADGQDALVRRMPIVGSAGTGAPPQNP